MPSPSLPLGGSGMGREARRGGGRREEREPSVLGCFKGGASSRFFFFSGENDGGQKRKRKTALARATRHLDTLQLLLLQQRTIRAAFGTFQKKGKASPAPVRLESEEKIIGREAKSEFEACLRKRDRACSPSPLSLKQLAAARHYKIV